MSDWAEGDEEEFPKPKRTSGLAWAIVFLIFLWVIVDIIAMNTLGSNANDTFQTVPTKK